MERSRVEINLDAFRANLRNLKKLLRPDQAFLQIVKADAYGHGAEHIAKVALEEGAECLGVANVDEGSMLRLQGFKCPILVLSPCLDTEIDIALDYDLQLSVSDQEFADLISEKAVSKSKACLVHIKVDTGMHRSGCSYKDFWPLYEHVSSLQNVITQGVYSHYAASENDIELTKDQSKRFEDICSGLVTKPHYIHIANSSAILTYNSHYANLVRLGILSYGIYTDPEQVNKIDLKPVMTFKSVVSQVKKINAGRGLGYNHTWIAPRDSCYAIVPVGYADGYDYLLGNKAFANIAGTNFPVIGKISMDMLCLDITDYASVAIGDSVILIGAHDPRQRAENLCKLYNGSPYELLCQVGRRAKRHYISKDTVISSSPLSRRDFVSSDFSDTKLNRIIQSALSQRLQNEEIGDLIYKEILKSFFYNKDKDIQYRHDFSYKVRFLHLENNSKFLKASINLSFYKILQNNYFIIACANSEDVLKRYFMRRDVEYRWLMDTGSELSAEEFKLKRISLNGLEMDTEIHIVEGCLEIRCSHPNLQQMIGNDVHFEIESDTLYPKDSHQLSVFVTELTRGVSIRFEYPDDLKAVDPVCIFSGQSKYPDMLIQANMIDIKTPKNQWVFPMSGVVFAY